MDFYPIDIFDSGVGGLTVARMIIDQFPEESIIYIGDTAHIPYGPRPIVQMCELALDVMGNPVDSDVKILVIVCNSASATVLYGARERYQAVRSIPVVKVIQPAIRRVVSATRNRHIGVAGTGAIIGSGAYEDAFVVALHLTLTTAAHPEFAELVEAGITTGPQTEEVARRYLASVRDAGVDTLVFGCTHYPLLMRVTGYTMGESITLASSADETARDIYAKLTPRDLFAPSGNEPDRRFYATEDLARLGELMEGSLSPEVDAVCSISQISSGVSA